MKYGNCVVWALVQKLKFGGYLHAFRSPGYWYVPSVIWSPDNKLWYKYIATNRIDKPSFWKNLFPIHTLVFKGVVRKVKMPF